MTINLHLGDCLEAMREMPDNYAQLAIVDPPYGIGMDKDILDDHNAKHLMVWQNPKVKEYKKGNWDNTPPSQEYFNELLRVSRKQIIWGCNYFTDKLPVSGGRIYWSKGVMMPTLSKGELAWTNLRNSIDQIDLLWAGYRKCEESERFHPTQKPVKLYETLLDRYAKEGDRILDTHLGSGSIAIAVHNLSKEKNLSLEGYELDPDYYQAACNRLQEHQKQLRLF